MYIENLTEQEINSAKKAKELLISGFKNRHVASTSMNHESSRSHLIYTLFLSTKLELGDGILKMRSSRLHLVDLAGSERQKYTNTTGQRIKEAGNINKSLSILGNVINAVIEFNEGKTKFVPFRDSKLTYYLKDSIGGNSKTVIIGNISQSFIQINETQSTLNFIQRAKMIKNKSKIIENVNDMVKMLQNEIKNLKIINEELNKKLEDLIKENDEQKKNIEIINKKNKNIKKKKEIMVEDLRENHTYNRVCFEVTLLDEYAKKFKQDNDLFIKTFNLQSTINIKNMVLFSPEGKLKKYNTIEEILETFYNLRLEYYHIRKDYMISVLKKEVATLSNKARFIKMVIEDELIIKKKKRVILVNELYDLKFDTQTMLNEKKMKTKEEINAEIELHNNNDNNIDTQNNNEGEGQEEQENDNKKIKPKVPLKEYDYLLNMNLWSLTYEKIEELLKQKEQKEKELSILEETKVEKLWDDDLDNFEEELVKYEKKEEEDRLIAQKLNKGKSGKIPKRRKAGGGRKKKGDVSDTSSVNDSKSENYNSNNTSSLSETTANITKEKKEKKKKAGQSSISDFIISEKKEKDQSKSKSKTKEKSKEKKKKKKKSESEPDSASVSVSQISASVNKNSLSESSADENDESSFFKIPLKERLKKRNINIGNSPLPSELQSYGPADAKRDGIDDFSDFDLSFDDNEQME